MGAQIEALEAYLRASRNMPPIMGTPFSDTTWGTGAFVAVQPSRAALSSSSTAAASPHVTHTVSQTPSMYFNAATLNSSTV